MYAKNKVEFQQTLYNWLNFSSLTLGALAILMMIIEVVMPRGEVPTWFLPIALIILGVLFYTQLSMAQFARPGVSINGLPPSVVDLLTPDYHFDTRWQMFLVRNHRGFERALNHYRCTTNHLHGLKWTEGELRNGKITNPDFFKTPLLVKFTTESPLIKAEFFTPD